MFSAYPRRAPGPNHVPCGAAPALRATPPSRTRAFLTCLLLVAGSLAGQQPARPRAEPVEAAATSATDEAHERLQHGRALRRRGERDAALRELLACFDETAANRAFWATRLGALLDEFGALAREDPPARAALIERRDAKAETVSAGALGNDDVAELLALDEVLGEGAHAVRVFHALAPRHARAELAFFYHGIRSELWRQRRYRTLVEHRPEPQERLQTAATALREAGRRLAGNELRPDPRFTERVVAEVAIDVEARLGLGEFDAAERLIDATLAFAPGPATAARLVAHAERAGRASRAVDVERVTRRVCTTLRDAAAKSFDAHLQRAREDVRAREQARQ